MKTDICVAIEALESKLTGPNGPDNQAILNRIELLATQEVSSCNQWNRINWRIHSAYFSGNHELGYRYCGKAIRQMRNDKGQGKTIGQVTTDQARKSHRLDLDNTFTDGQLLEVKTSIRKSDKKVIKKGYRLSARYLTGTSQNHIDHRDQGEGQDGYHSGIVEFLIRWNQWLETMETADVTPMMPINDKNGNPIGIVPVNAPRLSYGWLRLGCRRVTDSSKNWKRKSKDIGAYKLRRHWEFMESNLPESIEFKSQPVQTVKPIIDIGTIKNEIKGFPVESRTQKRTKQILLAICDGIPQATIAQTLGLPKEYVWKTVSRFRLNHSDLASRLGRLVLVEV